MIKAIATIPPAAKKIVFSILPKFRIMTGPNIKATTRPIPNRKTWIIAPSNYFAERHSSERSAAFQKYLKLGEEYYKNGRSRSNVAVCSDTAANGSPTHSRLDGSAGTEWPWPRSATQSRARLPQRRPMEAPEEFVEDESRKRNNRPQLA